MNRTDTKSMAPMTNRLRGALPTLEYERLLPNMDDECRNGCSLSALLLRFSDSMMLQVWQSAMCSRCHTVEKRIVRRLLMTSDRIGTNKFKISQDVLSNMIGVRREAIRLAAGSLRKKGLVTYTRGNISILDRPALEASACKCYSIIREEQRVSNLRLERSIS